MNYYFFFKKSTSFDLKLLLYFDFSMHFKLPSIISSDVGIILDQNKNIIILDLKYLKNIILRGSSHRSLCCVSQVLVFIVTCTEISQQQLWFPFPTEQSVFCWTFLEITSLFNPFWFISVIYKESQNCSIFALTSVMMTFLKRTQTEIPSGVIQEREFIIE